MFLRPVIASRCAGRSGATSCGTGRRPSRSFSSPIGARVPVTLVYSSRTRDDVIYYDELERLAGDSDGLRVIHTLTRAQPPGWAGLDRRIDRPMLEMALDGDAGSTQAFVCGPTPLVESVAEALVGLGFPPSQVRTERFGPSGG
jgi:ferredoxin-NADP reductase